MRVRAKKFHGFNVAGAGGVVFGFETSDVKQLSGLRDLRPPFAVAFVPVNASKFRGRTFPSSLEGLMIVRVVR